MSVARKRNTCSPGSRSATWKGDSHEPNGSASRAHSYSTIGPSAEKVNQAVMLVLNSAGPEWIVVSGAIVSSSYVQLQVAGDGSALRDRSTARTWKLCSPG